MRLTYLIGQPGAGKSTLLAKALEGLPMLPERLPGGLWVTWHGWIAELGRRRSSFSGTDALSMGVMPHACAWVRDSDAPLVVGEGDRLASVKFLAAAADAGRHVELAVLDVPDEVAQARREARSQRHQSASWIAGRITKVANLTAAATALGYRVRRIDGTASLADQLDALGAWQWQLHSHRGRQSPA